MDSQLLFSLALDNQNRDLYVKKSFTKALISSFSLYVDNTLSFPLGNIRREENDDYRIYHFLLPDGFSFVPGKRYEILTQNNFFVPVDISFLARTPSFEEKYRFDGQRGAIYTKKKTIFRVFAPFATSCHLLLLTKQGSKSFSRKHNLENGIYELVLFGNYEKEGYLYEVETFGKIVRVVDPYAFSLSSNGRRGYIVDLNKVKAFPSHDECLKKFSSPDEAIIYECHVRDRTSLTQLNDRGTFSALARSGEKNKEGRERGIDYISALGFTHVQLRPVLDYQSVNEDDVFSQYNWGYDPSFYFAPEGSYSSNPSDPYARLRELKELVSAFHQKGIRVNLDVVYNHVFSHDFNSLNLLCPNYYFRYNADGSLSNGTGCGNDLESRNYRVRKLIVDSLRFRIDVYDVDGFRFDLRGIRDIKTLTRAYQACKRKKADILFYGEGWDLYTNLPGSEKANRRNGEKLPFCGFFNDRFRDIVKGKSGQDSLAVKGYLLGETSYRDGFKHVRLGSSSFLAFPPLFSSFLQSVNYVQCHDDACLYDKIRIALPLASEEEVLKRIKRINVAVLFALGIPFFSEGQEIGKSKSFHFNTYNAGDKINGFDYTLAYKRKDRVSFLKDAIKRKKRVRAKTSLPKNELTKRIHFEDLPLGGLLIDAAREDYDLYLLFNPSKDTIRYDFPEDVRLLFNEAGDVSDSKFMVHLAIVPGCSVSLYRREKAVGRIYKEEEK